VGTIAARTGSRAQPETVLPMTDRITIPLSGRRPVSIDRAEWPTVARAKDWRGGSVECQANETFDVRVRQHADGRAVVIADRDRGPGGMPLGYRGGYSARLVAAGGDVAQAVTLCAAEAGIDPSVAANCIADLPAEEL
jgi:hypothetical protein